MPELLQEAEQVRDWLQPAIEHDAIYDLIGGAAGAIGGLLSLYRCRPTPRTLEVAMHCGDWLLEQAQSMEHGLAWLFQSGASAAPLTGFAHGAAGIAAALLELFGVSGRVRFRQAALAAIAYERSHFSVEAGNWRDLRAGDHPQFSFGWCHGAPGIGLARLQTLPLYNDPAVEDEIAVAVQTTLAHGFGPNHSLCHGDLGNLELVVEAARAFNLAEWHEQAQQQAEIIMSSISNRGWQCGVARGVETLGLMTGIAGIGYGLLRLAAPERVPIILQLEAPRLSLAVAAPLQHQRAWATATQREQAL